MMVNNNSNSRLLNNSKNYDNRPQQQQQQQHDDDVIAIDDNKNNLSNLVNDIIVDSYENSNNNMIDEQHQQQQQQKYNKNDDILDNNNNNDYIDTECQICKKSFIGNNPKMLSCLHSYCENCLKSLINKVNENKSVFVCLICKQESDIECLIDNLFTYDTSSSSSSNKETINDSNSKIEPQQMKCTNCDENNQAEWFCTNCSEWLCEECKIAHTRVKLTKDHSILHKTAVKQQLEEQQQQQQQAKPQNKIINTNQFCNIHLKEKLYLYCETCDILTCRDCQLSSRHKEHKYKFINEAAAQQRLQFQIYLDKLKKRKKFLQTAYCNIDSRKADINVKSNSTINDIKTISSNLIIELSKRTAYLIENLKFICNEKITNLNKKSNELRAYLKKFNHCINIIDNAIKSNNETAILLSKRLIINQLNNLLNEKCEVLNPSHQFQIQFINETAKVNHLLTHIGHLMIDGKTFGKSSSNNNNSTIINSNNNNNNNTNGQSITTSPNSNTTPTTNGIKTNNGIISPSNSPSNSSSSSSSSNHHNLQQQQQQINNNNNNNISKSVSPNPYSRASLNSSSSSSVPPTIGGGVHHQSSSSNSYLHSSSSPNQQQQQQKKSLNDVSQKYNPSSQILQPQQSNSSPLNPTSTSSLSNTNNKMSDTNSLLINNFGLIVKSPRNQHHHHHHHHSSNSSSQQQQQQQQQSSQFSRHSLIQQHQSQQMYQFQTQLQQHMPHGYNQPIRPMATYAVTQPVSAPPPQPPPSLPLVPHTAPLIPTPSPPLSSQQIHSQQQYHHHLIQQQQQQQQNRLSSNKHQQQQQLQSLNMPRLQKIAPYPHVHVNEKLVMDSNSINQNKAVYLEQLNLAKQYSAFDNQQQQQLLNNMKSSPPILKPINNNLSPLGTNTAAAVAALPSKSLAKAYSAQTQPPLLLSSSSSLPQITDATRESVSPQQQAIIEKHTAIDSTQTTRQNENVHESSVVWTEQLTKQVTKVINSGPTISTSNNSINVENQQINNNDGNNSQDSERSFNNNLMVDDDDVDDDEENLEEEEEESTTKLEIRNNNRIDDDEQDNNCYLQQIGDNLNKNSKIVEIEENNNNNHIIREENLDEQQQQPPLTTPRPLLIEETVINDDDDDDDDDDRLILDDSNKHDHLIPDDSNASTAPSLSSTLVQHKLSVSSNENTLNKNEDPNKQQLISEAMPAIKLKICKIEAKEFSTIKKEAIDDPNDFIVLVDTLSEDYSNDFCVICRNGGDLLICDYCPRVYHLQCHVPSIHVKPEGDWQCGMCESLHVILKNKHDINENTIKIAPITNSSNSSFGSTSSSSSTSLSSKRKAPLGLNKWELSVCERILLLLYTQNGSSPFHQPVNRTVQNYYRLIKHPMDLKTIKHKLSRGHFDHYNSIEDFISDCRLVFSNCAQYNPSDTEIGRIGREISDRFENFISIHLSEYSAKQATLQNSASGTRLNESTPASCIGGHSNIMSTKTSASPASFSSENSNSSYTCDSNSQTNLSVNNDSCSSRPPRNKRKRTNNHDEK